MARALQRVMLTQANPAWFGKRPWTQLPYGLGLLSTALKRRDYDSWIYDPSCLEHSLEEVRAELLRTQPDVVGVGSGATEYKREVRAYTQLIKETLPQATVVLGGLLPTVQLERAIEDPHVDYFVTGEGEYRLPRLLDALNDGGAGLDAIDGLAYGEPRVIQPWAGFIADLDAVGLPDYGGLELSRYTQYLHRYAHHFVPRQFPWATTLTSRGCPYKCSFCAARTVSGKTVRLRSAENVLAEIDWLASEHGVREMIFNDDHFLQDRQRAIDIMQGIATRHPGMTWKCLNLSIWALDDEILELMRATGSYQLTVSIESGNQRVLKKIIHKPVSLTKTPGILQRAKDHGFEIAANFVFGLPGETWDEIRETIAYAADLPVDIVNFHLATPMPGTELMDVALSQGLLASADDVAGFTSSTLETDEFSSMELQVLRAFEWDRINFSTPERRATIARMEGISLEEVERWRRRTRQCLGSVANWTDFVANRGRTETP